MVTDLAIAVLAAILVLVLTPGVAAAGMIALLVLAACAISLVIDSRRSMCAESARRRRPAPQPQRRPKRRR